MKNLTMPGRAHSRADLLRAIRSYRYGGVEKGHQITENEVVEILNIYDIYDENLASPDDSLKGVGIAQSLRDAIYNAYDATQDKRRMQSIRERLTADVALCPICGIDPANELDHHLPRSVFKPLAIYERNLIPMCHTCNHTKLAGFGDEDGGRVQFLHAYFDVLPDIQFLHANVKVVGAGLVVKFSVAPHVVLPNNYEQRLTGQIESLSLNERYESEINTYLTSHSVTLHFMYRSGGRDAVRRSLILNAKHETACFYRNHWRPTLLAALAGNEDFINGGFADVFPVAEDLLEDIDNII